MPVSHAPVARPIRSGQILALLRLEKSAEDVSTAEVELLRLRKTRRSLRMDVYGRAAGRNDDGVLLGTQYTYGESSPPAGSETVSGVRFKAGSALRSLGRTRDVELTVRVLGLDGRELPDEEIVLDGVRLVHE